MQIDLSHAGGVSHETQVSAKVVRSCVHCGMCTATCPTYVLLGDELDSPRGRIYQIKTMLEEGGAPSAETVKHIDRCLSCLSCMSTCPSGVNYMHLIDHARAHVEANYKRPWFDAFLRNLLAVVLPNRALFRAALRLAQWGRPVSGVLPRRLRGIAAMAPTSLLPRPDPAENSRVFAAAGPRRARVALLAGCAQPVLAPQINAAAIRLLNRCGIEVVTARGSGCCGALTHHLGKREAALAAAKANIAAWVREADGEGLDAIVITASGCGTMVKDYGFMFADDPNWREQAARIAGLARDVSEVLATLELPARSGEAPALRVAYHSACSLQHGQGIASAPKTLLESAGYSVAEPAEAHLCCGSAGTYNLLQPEIAERLRLRKTKNIDALGADVIATGNVGCLTQLARGAGAPVVHTIELLDWATGGPAPASLAHLSTPRAP